MANKPPQPEDDPRDESSKPDDPPQPELSDQLDALVNSDDGGDDDAPEQDGSADSIARREAEIDETITAEERAVEQAMARAMGEPSDDDAPASDGSADDDTDALAQRLVDQADESPVDDEALSRSIQAEVDRAMTQPPAAQAGTRPDEFVAPGEQGEAADEPDEEAFDATFEPPPGVEAHDDQAPAQEAADDAPEGGDDIVGEDLAREIQDLLDEAKTAGETEVTFESPDTLDAPPPAPFESTAAPTESAEKGEEDQAAAEEDDLGGAFETVAEVERGERETQNPTVASASTEDADAAAELETVEQIDEMLADMADDAVAGAFETVADVLAMEAAGETPRAVSIDEHDSDRDAASLDAADDDLAGDFASPDELLQTDSEDMDFDGAFEAPEDLESAGVGASASDVSDELDSQPEAAAGMRRRRPREDDDDDAWPGDDARAGGLAARVRRAVVTAAHEAPEHARNACAVLNSPLRRVSPQTRDLIGYAGIMTLFFGTTLLALTFLGILPR